jgi:transcriptional regulator with XRE-family HTH domain
MFLNLKLQLWRRGMRQNQLARLLEMDETILSRIMNGFRPPAPEVRERIARLLEADEAWLFAIASDGMAGNGARGAEKEAR